MKKLLIAVLLLTGVTKAEAVFTSTIISTSSLQSGATVYVSSANIRNLNLATSGPYEQNNIPINIGDNTYGAGLVNLGQAINVGRTLTGIADMDGIEVTDAYNLSGSNQWAAFSARPTIIGTHTVTRAIGYQSAVLNSSATAISHLHDYYAGSYTNSGTVANRYGYFYRDDFGSGAITNQYGVYISTLTRGANDYPIYIADVTNPSFLGVFTASSATITTFTPTNLVGQANANVASAGNVGEVMLSSTPFATPAGMTSTSNIAVGTVTVTAGCWELTGTFYAKATNASTSFTLMTSWIGVTALTAPSSVCVNNQCSNGEIYMIDARPATVPGLNLGLTLNPPPVKVCVASPTTYYVGGAVTFSASTAGAVGGIRAQRIFH